MNLDLLKSRLDAYIQLRRSLGHDRPFEKSALEDFYRYLTQHDQSGPIRAETALNWASSASARCYRSGSSKRFYIVRGFLSYLKAFEPETEVPSSRLVVDPQRPKAYIYSPGQIQNMLEATSVLWKPGCLSQRTFYTLIGLLASTGLRIGEALRLTLRQVQLDLDPPRLEIRNTKFHKSRFVPIHPTTAEKLRQYLAERNKEPDATRSNTFFIGSRGRPLSYPTTRTAYHQIQRYIGIPKSVGTQGPAMHALRHTFAVQRLLSWYQAGADVRAQIPHLSVYMGHVGMVETYRYLWAAPELLTLAGEIFNRYSESGGPA